MLISAAIMNDTMRVSPAWYASAARSNIRLMCSSNVAGTPAGASGKSSFEKSWSAIFCTWRSISRTESRYSATRAWSAGAELAAQRRRFVADEIEQAARLRDDGFALGRRVALAEQAVEQLARVVLHRQRLRRRAERDRRAHAAAERRVAGRAAAGLHFGAELERRERRVVRRSARAAIWSAEMPRSRVVESSARTATCTTATCRDSRRARRRLRRPGCAAR